MSSKYPVWKRACDIAGGSAGFLCLCVFFPFAAAAIVLESGFPVFVKLERISEGRSIYVWKFRTMVRGAHSQKKDLSAQNERNDGPLFKMKRDPRVTRVGRVLRKLRIDEFPQAINVLNGDMALVGPRPHEPEEIARYPEEFKTIALVRAGVTGLSQVNGASSLPFKKELELDCRYIGNVSFFGDVKILLKTILVFFFDPTGV